MLTTPEIIESDPSFPGENWFFYWKTSPSLWESKLRNFSQNQIIFAPIYWGLHSNHPDHYDFAKRTPETDLKKLSEVAESLNLQLVFILFLGPAPFLPNGGLPTYLAKTLTCDQKGIAKVVVNNDETIHKIYSFFDPRVFQSFRKFIFYLNEYFQEENVNNLFYGAKSYYTQNGRFESYLLDSSKIFENGFSRFVKQIQDEEPHRFVGIENNKQFELILKKEFKDLIDGLYLESVKELLGSRFKGSLDFCFLGGATEDVLLRSNEGFEDQHPFYKQFFHALGAGYIPSSVLLSHRLKKNTLGVVLKDYFKTGFYKGLLSEEIYEDDFSSHFTHLTFFRLFIKKDDYFRCQKYLRSIGVLRYLDGDFKNTYLFKDISEKDEFDEDAHNVNFYFGRYLDNKTFTKMLKSFMNGECVYLDKSFITPELDKRLDLFLIENDFEVEKINYLTMMTKVKLGEGNLFIFDGEKLKEAPVAKLISFWATLLKYSDIKHLKVDGDLDIFYLWKMRLTNPMELNYEHVRRLSLYNPSSYKKEAKIYTQKNFALIKTIDSVNVTMKSTPMSVDLILMPGGSVSIDFGYFE